MLDIKFTPKLRPIRESKGLSRRELAIKAGVTEQTVKNLELYVNTPARNPNLTTIARIAWALDCSMWDIIEVEQPPKEA